MSSFFGSGPMPDWQEIRKWLGKEIPGNMVEQWEKSEDGQWLDRLLQGLLNPDKPADSTRTAKTKTKNEDGKWLSQFVKGLLKPDASSDKAESKSLVKMETEKESKRLTVTLQIPHDTNMRALQLFATSDLLRVTGLPDNRTHTVRFPCRVYPRSGRAQLDGNRIAVKFRRRPPDQNEVELFIRT
jgi:hypothetical protein